MRLTQPNFDKLCDYMNHKITEINEKLNNFDVKISRVKVDMEWVKKILYIQSTMLAGVLSGLTLLLIKTVLQ